MNKRKTIARNPLDFVTAGVPTEAEPDRPVERVRQISARIPEPLYKRLKVAVARSDESQQDYLARIIADHLDGEGV